MAKNIDYDFTVYPHIFAQWASEGKWIAYPWISYLSQRITKKLYEGNARILVTAPPQHGKSRFLSEWVPTWHMNKFPEKKIILGTYAQSYADKWGGIVRDNLLHKPRARVALKIDSQSKRKFETEAGGQMLCVGVEGPATGESADLLIVDDPFKSWEEAMSPRIRERNMDWFRSVATTRLQRGGSVIIMHTRWHEADLIGELATEDGWELINLPAIALENDPMGRAIGEALCPQRYTAPELGKIRTAVKEMIWTAMYQGDPVIVGGNIIRGEWIQTYFELPKTMDEIAIFADLTYEKKEQNDFTVIEAWGRKGADIYLITQIRDHMGFQDQMKGLGRMFDIYPNAFHKEIEKKANGAAVIEMVQQMYPGVEANNPHTSKEARLAVVAPLYHAGNVYYPDESIAPWVKVNRNEITKFPSAAHDDTVDVATMAVNYFGKIAGSMKQWEALGQK